MFRSKAPAPQWAPRKFAGEISDDQVTMIRHVIANRFSFHPHVGDMYDAITARSREHMFNPVVDWLDSLKWDGQPRLDRWMIEHLGADDSSYVRAVSRKAIVAAVRRAKHPGCKFDHMLILCGPQDIGKSFCIADCAGVPELFSDADLLTKSGKEQLEAVEGKWFYEIAECDGMDKVAVTKTKSKRGYVNYMPSRSAAVTLDLLAGLLRAGLAVAEPEIVKVGGRMIGVVRIAITPTWRAMVG
jgi:predicted P-loop ATPase